MIHAYLNLTFRRNKEPLTTSCRTPPLIVGTDRATDEDHRRFQQPSIDGAAPPTPAPAARASRATRSGRIINVPERFRDSNCVLCNLMPFSSFNSCFDVSLCLFLSLKTKFLLVLVRPLNLVTWRPASPCH